MSKVWISRVDAPKEVYSDSTFDVEVKVGYWGLPTWWTKKALKLFAELIDGTGFSPMRIEDDLSTWWFWGSKTFLFSLDDLSDDILFTMQVGYRDDK